jgi:hypothetical protein
MCFGEGFTERHKDTDPHWKRDTLFFSAMEASKRLPNGVSNNVIGVHDYSFLQQSSHL